MSPVDRVRADEPDVPTRLIEYSPGKVGVVLGFDPIEKRLFLLPAKPEAELDVAVISGSFIHRSAFRGAATGPEARAERAHLSIPRWRLSLVFSLLKSTSLCLSGGADRVRVRRLFGFLPVIPGLGRIDSQDSRRFHVRRLPRDEHTIAVIDGDASRVDVDWLSVGTRLSLLLDGTRGPCRFLGRAGLMSRPGEGKT